MARKRKIFFILNVVDFMLILLGGFIGWISVMRFTGAGSADAAGTSRNR